MARARVFGRVWLAASLTVLAGCGAPPATQPEVRIASDATFRPFHFLAEDGTPTGYEIEVAREAAERAGLRPIVVIRAYDELLTGLAAGDHEIVAATTGVTPERERLYMFATPHFETCQAALVRGGAEEPQTTGDLAGRRVGASGSGTSALAMRGIAGAQPVVLGKGQQGVPALEAGEIDALVLDEFDAVAAARRSNGRLRVLSDPVARESYALVIAPGNQDLKARLDRALGELEQEGRLTALRARFGVERDEAWPVAFTP